MDALDQNSVQVCQCPRRTQKTLMHISQSAQVICRWCRKPRDPKEIHRLEFHTQYQPLFPHTLVSFQTFLHTPRYFLM